MLKRFLALLTIWAIPAMAAAQNITAGMTTASTNLTRGASFTVNIVASADVTFNAGGADFYITYDQAVFSATGGTDILTPTISGWAAATASGTNPDVTAETGTVQYSTSQSSGSNLWAVPTTPQTIYQVNFTVKNDAAFGATTLQFNPAFFAILDGTFTPMPNIAGTPLALTIVEVNNPPTVSDISNQTVNTRSTLGPVSFTVTDENTAGLNITASSGNTTLIPNANITLGGANGARTISITPADCQVGTTTITVTVSDGVNTAVTDQFDVTVNNTAPDVVNGNAGIADQMAVSGLSSGDITFTVSDAETPAGSLTVGPATSSNPTVIPDGSITLGGTGSATRTIRFTPTAGQTGDVFITIPVSDCISTTPTTFKVTVGANQPPTVNSPILNVIEYRTVSTTLTFDDPDGPEASVVASIGAGDEPLLGTANITGFPTVSYTNTGGFFGGVLDEFFVTLTDIGGAEGTSTVIVNIFQNFPPKASDTTLTRIRAQASTTIDLNISDANSGDASLLTLSQYSTPTFGTLSFTNPNRVVYTPGASAPGQTDMFRVLVKDPTGVAVQAAGSDTATVNVTINNPPMFDVAAGSRTDLSASDDTIRYEFFVDEGVSVAVRGYDQDGDDVAISETGVTWDVEQTALNGVNTGTADSAYFSLVGVNPGTYTSKVTVTDPLGDTGDLYIIVVVKALIDHKFIASADFNTQMNATDDTLCNRIGVANAETFRLGLIAGVKNSLDSVYIELMNNPFAGTTLTQGTEWNFSNRLNGRYPGAQDSAYFWVTQTGKILPGTYEFAFRSRLVVGDAIYDTLYLCLTFADMCEGITPNSNVVRVPLLYANPKRILVGFSLPVDPTLTVADFNNVPMPMGKTAADFLDYNKRFSTVFGCTDDPQVYYFGADGTARYLTGSDQLVYGTQGYLYLKPINAVTIYVTGKVNNSAQTSAINANWNGSGLWDGAIVGNPFNNNIRISGFSFGANNGYFYAQAFDGKRRFVDPQVDPSAIVYKAEAGFFFTTSSSVTISNVVATARLQNDQTVAATDWRAQLAASAGQVAGNDAYFGVGAGYDNDYVAYQDAPELLNATREFVRVAFPHSDWATDRTLFVQDLRASGQDQSWDVEVEANTDEAEIMLDWSDLASLANGYRFQLVDLTNNVTVDMRANSQYVFPNTLKEMNRMSEQELYLATGGSLSNFFVTRDVERVGKIYPFRIIVTNESAADADHLGNDAKWNFQLAQNRPNPFAPMTSIYFQVPTVQRVSLKVFNAAGQLVKVLHDGEVAAGPTTMTWDGSNDSGVAVGSGIYFYQLEAAGFKETKRMVLTR